MDQSGINFENGAQGMVWSEGFERVPLKQRLKLLLASHRASVGSDVKLDSQGHVLLPNGGPETDEGHVDAKDSQFHCFGAEPMNGSITIPMEEQNAVLVLENAGKLGACQESLTHQHTSSSSDIADSSCGSLLAKLPVTVKIECAENIGEGTSSNHLTGGSSLAVVKSVTVEPETSRVYLDEIDHVALKERLRRLLTSNSPGLKSEMLQRNTPAAAKEDFAFGNQQHAMPENKMHEAAQALMSVVSMGAMDSSCKPHRKLGGFSQGNKSSSSVSSGIKSGDNIYSEKECPRYGCDGGKALPSTDSKNGQSSAMPIVAKIKVEHPTYDEFQTSFVSMNDHMPFTNLVQVKSELQNASYEYEDELDHMLLQQRMKLLSSVDGPTLDIKQSSKCTNKAGASALGFTSVALRSAQSLKFKHARKRRKTATDSVETAMEEDAPGLLQVLMEKGVLVDEIKLYGEPESNDALDDSSTSDDFVELEEIISKVFSKREPLLKFAPVRCNRGEKATYCLECLFSLVEQARYLRFRNWPVEWGWCRDLQSFIFVFERHNRIVLERPEYGYATYFFELAESSSIGWQIKRLVTAMKLNNCSRATLIENKALMVGNDLTEGEAGVLMEYGWVPNTSLGTMLNYYDRVVHDRKNEDRSEWRSKIGKLLMDGFNGGTIVSTGIVPKVECELEQPSVDIKLELT